MKNSSIVRFSDLKSTYKFWVGVVPLLFSGILAAYTAYVVGTVLASHWGVNPKVQLNEQPNGLSFVTAMLGFLVTFGLLAWAALSAVIAYVMLDKSQRSWITVFQMFSKGIFPAKWANASKI